MKKTTNKLFFSLFGLGWSALIVWNIVTPVKTFSENENRYLTQFPAFSIGNFVDGQFMKDMDTYINDQFIARDQWITLKVALEKGLHKQEVNNIVFGKDSYLIEQHPQSSINQQLLDNNLEALINFVNKQSASLQTHVMMVPTASTILKDKLPPFAESLGFDQLAWIQQLQKQLNNQTVLDISETLSMHRDESIYYRTDHHWTTDGAYLAYQQWAKASGFQPLSLQEWTQVQVTDSFLGTLHSKVNASINPDTIEMYQLKQAIDYQVTFDGDKVQSSFYDYQKLEGKDKYAFFLGGNNALVQIKTPLQNQRKLLIIKDSFANAFVPFAVNHFEETVVVDLRFYNGNLNELIAENNITDLLVLYNVIGFATDTNVTKLP
ncbi:MAG: hypothetical protein GXY98_02190 [Erysipelothrix sp.]|nr:hypothetical protein [Erysipelothrix sp.]